MDGLPEELLLYIFDELCYNDLRPVLATCARWRALAQRCRAFWADIRTPDTYATASDAGVFYRRLECTRGRGLTQCLTGASPDILDAIARAAGDLEHLDVQLYDYDDVQDAFWMLRKVSAPRLRRLDIRLGFTSAGVLPDELFAETACPLLDRVYISAYNILGGKPLPCFSRVRDVRLDSAGSLHPTAPDLFAHFPSMELLDLNALTDMSSEDIELGNPFFTKRLRQSDWARLRYLGLRNTSWVVLTGIGCPLQQIPHVFADTPDCFSLPFPVPFPPGCGHLVVEMRNPEATECVVILGNAEWSASRSAAICTSELGDIKPYDVASASVPHAGLPAVSRIMSLGAPATLRIILHPGDTELKTVVSDAGLHCAALRTLVFCCPTAGRCARITRRQVMEFARGYLRDAQFPLHLQLEKFTLEREPGLQAEFASVFGTVETRDADKWSYLRVRDMLNRYDD